MQQVIVDEIGLKFVQLVLKYLFRAAEVAHHIMRQFGRDINLFSVPALQRFAEDLFAFTAVIDIRRVKVIHAFGDGITDHRDGSVFIYASALHGKAHAAKPKY